MPWRTQTSSSSGLGLPGWWRPRRRRTPGGRSSCSIRRAPASLGGQAWWSLGGLFLVNTPEQRQLGVKDSAELALADWLGSAGFDRPEDHWPRQWAEAYVDFAAGEKRAWLKEQGLRCSRSSSGRNAAVIRSAGTATRFPASTSPGDRDPAC